MLRRVETNAEVANDLGAALDLAMHLFCILLHSEGTTCPSLPEVLLVIVVLADDPHLV